MKYSHGSGGKVRNRGLSSMGVSKAMKLCKSQGKPGLVSVRRYKNTKAHQRCFPIRKKAAPKKSRKGVSTFGKKLRKKAKLIRM